MEKWIGLVIEVLTKAELALVSGEVERELVFKLAPIYYSELNKTNSDQLFSEMTKQTDELVYSDWAIDPKSKEQYKFHLVSSFLYCYVVAGKINESKYDDIMQFINDNVDLFNAN